MASMVIGKGPAKNKRISNNRGVPWESTSPLGHLLTIAQTNADHSQKICVSFPCPSKAPINHN
jgi:hypothetical protein